jgi:hypothetical protein
VDQRVGLELPAAQIRRASVPDRRPVVTLVRIQERARGAQEEQVVLAAVADCEPAVPEPVIGQTQRQPFTPLAAMLLTNARR